MINCYRVLAWKVGKETVAYTVTPANGWLSTAEAEMRSTLAEELWEGCCSHALRTFTTPLLTLYDKDVALLCDDFRSWFLFVQKHVSAADFELFYDEKQALNKAKELNQFCNFNIKNQGVKKMASIIAWKVNGEIVAYGKAEDPTALRSNYISKLAQELTNSGFGDQGRAPRGIFNALVGLGMVAGIKRADEMRNRLYNLVHYDVIERNVDWWKADDKVARLRKTLGKKQCVSGDTKIMTSNGMAFVQDVASNITVKTMVGTTYQATEVEWQPKNGKEILVAQTVVDLLKEGEYLSEDVQDMLMRMLQK